jgi:hypothetical protein
MHVFFSLEFRYHVESGHQFMYKLFIKEIGLLLAGQLVIKLAKLSRSKCGDSTSKVRCRAFRFLKPTWIGSILRHYLASEVELTADLIEIFLESCQSFIDSETLS